MITTLRSSTLRLLVGAGLGVAGLAVAVFVLPDASQKLTQKQNAAKDAEKALDRQTAELKLAEQEAGKLKANRAALNALLANMPVETVGKLHWKLSSKLYELAAKDSVRLVAVKYGPAAREGTKGSQLESVDVEFSVSGIYMNLKAFMLSLEGSHLPFAVVSAKLDESPEGAHLTVTLRAFRQATTPSAEAQGDTV